MAVNALDEDRFSVDIEQFALDLDRAETCRQVRRAAGFLSIGRNDFHIVKVRGLGAPKHYIVKACRSLKDLQAILDGGRLVQCQRISQPWNFEYDFFYSFGGQYFPGQVAFRISVDVDVLDMLFLSCREVSLAGDSGQLPEILILKVSAVAPPEYLECEQVLLSRLYEPGDIESRLQLAVLTVADLLAVDPDPDVGCGRADVQDDLLSVPVSGNSEGIPVLSDVVLFDRNVRRIVLELAFPAVADVDVERIPVAVDLPYSRNRHFAPVRIIGLGLEECGGAAVMGLVPFEFPKPVKRHQRVIRVEGGPHRETVPLHDRCILPVRVGLSRLGLVGAYRDYSAQG